MTQGIDVTPDQRKTLLSLLANHLPNTEAWVYGSRVRWTSRPESDLDMAVFATPSQVGDVSALRDALETSDLPFRVDLLVWDEIPDNFRKQVQREHVVLAEANEVQSTRRVFGTSGCSDVGNEWRESTWGEEITLEYGKALRGHATSTGAYRVFGSNGPIGWTDKALAPGPGVILGRKGAYRGVQYSPDPFFVIDTAYYVVPKSQHDMRWLYFAIKHYKLGEIDDGSPIPSTTRAAVYPRKLFIPLFPEQRAIARILGTLDDKIELNRRTNETLEAVARATFKDWFVDFGPVRAKIQGRTPYLSPQVWNLFPDTFDDEDKPAGWTRERIGIHATAVKGISYKGADLTDGVRGMPLHNLNSVLEGGGYKNDGLKFYMGDYKSKHLARPGDLVVANTEQGFGHLLIGFSALIPSWVGEVGLFSHHLYKIQLRSGSHLSRVWLHFALSSSPIGETLRQFSNGTTVNMLPADAFEVPEIVVPPIRIVQAFDTIVAPMLANQSATVTQSRTLSSIRDLLVPKLFSGEMRLVEVQKLMETIM